MKHCTDVAPRLEKKVGRMMASNVPRFSPWTVAGCLVLLLSCFSINRTVAAESDGGDRLQQQIVEALAQGRDARALLEQFQRTRAANPAPAESLAPRSESAAELQQQLLNFEAALARSSQSALTAQVLGSLSAQYDALTAAHWLLQERFASIDAQLQAEGVASNVRARNADAQQSWTKTYGELQLALDPVLGAEGRVRHAEAASNSAVRTAAAQAIESARKILAAHVSRTPDSILRASTLPYRRTQLAARAPRTTPTIVPSYLNTSETQTVPLLADSAATVDAPLTEEILRQAAQLNHDYIRIFEFVRNEIRTEWYAGAMKGAAGTLLQRSGNDVDQANLLIALFRASGLPSRYVHGVIELPIEEVISSLALTSAEQATTALARAGVAYAPVIRGGRVAAVQVEHTWVTAHVPYTNYRGALVDTSGALWLPLMPALKRYNVVPATRVFSAAGLSATTVADEYLAQQQSGDLLGLLRKKVNDHLQSSGATTTYEQQLGASTIVAQVLGLLPNTLPVPVVAVTGENAELTDAYRQRIRFVVKQGTREADRVLLDYSLPISEVASHRLTLSYIPATVDDHKTVNLFGGLDYTPAYLIKLRPQLKINGRAKSVAEASLDAGARHRLEVHLIAPFGNERVDQIVTAGGYQAFGIYAQKVARAIPANDPADTEFLAARLLYSIAYSYAQRWESAEGELGGLLDVAYVRPWPSLAIVGNSLRVDTVAGRVMQLGWEGVNLDAAMRVAEPVARNGNAVTGREWMQLAALEGSSLEQQIFSDEFLVDSISADKGLRLARLAGQEIVRVTSANVAAVLPTINHSPEVEADIENWTRLGFAVDVPRNPIVHRAWQGSVWRALDTNSGAAGYFIAGGLAGGETAEDPDFWLLDWLRDALAAPNTAPPNDDPLSGAYLSLSDGDGQTTTVGAEVERPLSVLVTDSKRRPVIGAEVTFRSTSGGGLLVFERTQMVDGVPVTERVTAAQVTTLTNNLGIATMRFEAGRVTSTYPIYVQRNLADQNVSRAGLNVIDVAANTHSGPLMLRKPFEVIGFPGAPVQFARANRCCIAGALPQSTIDIVNIVVRDVYENPVSNVPVAFNLQSTADGLAGTLFGGGSSGSSLSLQTSPYGATAGVVLGRALGYTLTATSALGTYSETYQLLTEPGLVWHSTLVMDEEGRNVAAAKVGERVRFNVEGGFSYYDGAATRTYRPWPLENIRSVITNGAAASTPRDIGGGSYRVDALTVGPTPGVNDLSFTARFHNPFFPDTPDQGTGYPRDETYPILRAFGLAPQILAINSDVGGDTIALNEDGLTLGPVTINYTTAPTNYRALAASVDVLRDNVWVGFANGSSREGAGNAPLARDEAFEIGEPYQAQLVLNRGTEVEVKSDPFSLPLRQKIFRDYDRDLSVRQEVDLLNQRTCTIGSSFKFELSQAADVELVAIDQTDPERRRTVFSRNFAAGEHDVAILPADLSAGFYHFTLTAVSDIDGHEEMVIGKAISQYVVRDAMPVGHVMVKGVDIKDGHMVLGTTDLSIPGRGAPLEFQRTYGSSGEYSFSPLGVRWTHNYLSKIVITPCGEAIVIGGEGGGMRFVDDGQGGLRPLMGYHGTLVANQVERAFDFYSKDGTRYHYRLMGSRTEWDLEYIEDTNGNVTKLGYDPASPAVAKLISVEDSAKRTLKFTYENRQFTILSGTSPILTRVEGPEGMRVDFTYDANGNLIRAAREGIKTENYGYSPLTASLVSSQVLTTYTNPNAETTTYTYNQAEVAISPQNLPSFMLPNSIVTEVRDAEGGVTEFDYDRTTWRRTTVTDARDHQTIYQLNAYGSPLSIQDPVGTTSMTWATDDIVMLSKTDARNIRTDYTYDDNGNVLSETVDGRSTAYTYETFAARPIKNRVRTRTDRNSKVTTYTYDTRGNLTLELNPESGETRHVYASNGDRIQTTDPNGNVTRFTYDSYGNLDSTRDALGGTTQTTWNVRSLPVTVTDALGRLTRIEYDTLNRPTRKTNARNGIRRYTYDAVGNKLTETDEEEHTTTWTYDGENRVLTIEDARDSIKNFGYDLVGNKTSETDWRGNLTSFAYDEANRLITRTEPLGRITRFTHDDVGNVLTETDPLLRVTTHEYDALNRRTQTTDAGDGIWVFGYDGVGNKTSERDALNRTTTFEYDGLNRLKVRTEPLGRITRYDYDANGNVTRETDPNGRMRLTGYDALNRPIRREDATGESTIFDYDSVGNLTVQIDARLSRTRNEYDELNRRTRTTGPTDAVTQFGYDGVGNLTSETWSNGNVLTHVYDELNRLTSTTDTLGPVLAYEYDAEGRRTRETDANGNATVNVYDELGRLRQTTQPEARVTVYGYDLVGNRTSETDPNQHQTTFAYDELNRLERVTDPLDHFIQYTYDAVGNKRTEVDKRNYTTTFDYDDLNRLTTVTDALTQGVSFTYDLVGNKLTETDKRGTLTSYTYDRENRQTQVTKAGVTLQRVQYDEVGNKKHETDANGNITTYLYDPRNLVLTESRSLAAITQYRYDSMGNRTELRDPENRISLYTYDERRRMLTETNAESEVTTYTYDDNGNRLTVRKPEQNTWTSVYDAANRLTSITDPLDGVTEFTYDNNDNRLTQVDANDRTTTFEYDELNRQTAMIYPDTERAEFRYDNNGNRIGLTDAKGQVYSYTFDALNRETIRTYPAPTPATGDDISSIVTQYDPNGNVTLVTESYSGATGTRVTTQHYDVFDRLLDVTDAFGEMLQYQYDANGNRTVLTDSDGTITRYNYDALNRVIGVTNSAGATTYAYDRSSLLMRTAYPNGSTATNTYDRALRTLTVTNRQAASTVSSYVYTYDDNGNRLTQVEANGAAAQTTSYTYDDNDRLTVVTYPDKTTTYTYDPAYNRQTEITVVTATSTTETNKTYAYNSRNQLTGITDNLSAANNVTYGYDDNGNQTLKTKNGFTTTFVYDVRDQLISVRQDATTLGLFRYDYQGLRIWKDMGGQVVRYTYDDDSVLQQTDINGATIAKYDYGVDQLLSLNHTTEGRQFYLFDALGSVSNLTTPAGAIQARYQYDAFGNIRSEAGDSYNRFTFTGHEKDEETGLLYFKARFYDPDTGRFLSQDPYLGEAGTPPSLHRYLYAYANPAVYVDLRGYAAQEANETGARAQVPSADEVKASIRKDLEELNKNKPNALKEFERQQREERIKKALRGAAATQLVDESAAAPGTQIDPDIEDVQREGRDRMEKIRSVMEKVYKGADAVSGLTGAKGAHDLVSELTTEDVQTFIRENPGKSAAAAALTVLCASKCKDAYKYLRGPGPAEAPLEALGKIELDALRAKHSLSQRDTIAVGRSDIRGLDTEVFEGMSPTLRREAGLPDLNVQAPERVIRAPFENPAFTRHAEEDLLNNVAQKIEKLKLTGSDLAGKTLRIHISNPNGVCEKCAVGLTRENQKAGVLKQFSERYPGLTLEVTAEGGNALRGHEVLRVRNGAVIEK